MQTINYLPDISAWRCSWGNGQKLWLQPPKGWDITCISRYTVTGTLNHEHPYDHPSILPIQPYDNGYITHTL